jgi:aldehyde dehydrogenase (NAD+)
MNQLYENLIGGDWVGPAGGRRFQRTNPANTSEIVGIFPALDDRNVARVIDAARVGLDKWRATKLLDRGRMLLRTAAIIRERLDLISTDLTREMGKTLAESRAEVAAAASFFEYYGGLARSPEGDVLADRREDAVAWTSREPIGVVVLITPWNDPVATPARKLGPALLCGNSVVLKPASYTPISSLHLARAFHEAGLPAGVVNTATGSGSTVGSALVRFPGVAAVSFTGSNAVGADLQAHAVRSPIRIQTELGGKNAVLVLSDADLELAVESIGGSAWGQAGQRCTSTSRVIVESPVYDEVVDRLVARAEALLVGSGLDSKSEMGPMVSQEQLESVLSGVEKSCAQGARLLSGGRQLFDGDHEQGHFMAPTILCDTDPDNIAWNEELFGPVLAVKSASSIQDGVDLVNQSRYGLSAAIFTSDLRAAHRFARDAEVGQVAINLPTAGWDVHVPFGGFKESGSAIKEQGREGLQFYSKTKSVVMYGG